MKGICAVTVKGAWDLKCFENSVLQCNIQAHFIHLVSSIYVLPNVMSSVSFCVPENVLTAGLSLPDCKHVEPGRVVTEPPDHGIAGSLELPVI